MSTHVHIALEYRTKSRREIEVADRIADDRSRPHCMGKTCQGKGVVNAKPNLTGAPHYDTVVFPPYTQNEKQVYPLPEHDERKPDEISKTATAQPLLHLHQVYFT